MKDYILTKMLRAVITWLTGLSKNGFQQVIDFVVEAQKIFGSDNGEKKKEWVKEHINKVLAISIPFVLNLLVEMAVAYAKKQGKI